VNKETGGGRKAGVRKKRSTSASKKRSTSIEGRKVRQRLRRVTCHSSS
jgi:hypothetical protein